LALVASGNLRLGCQLSTEKHLWRSALRIDAACQVSSHVLALKKSKRSIWVAGQGDCLSSRRLSQSFEHVPTQRDVSSKSISSQSLSLTSRNPNKFDGSLPEVKDMVGLQGDMSCWQRGGLRSAASISLASN